MKVKFHTNIDKWKLTQWPTDCVTAPLKGDLVEGICGKYRPQLEVASRVHSEQEVYYGNEKVIEPVLLIDLGVPSGLTLKGLGWDR